MYYIYALVDPINNVPFYVGKGKNKRAFSHLRGNCEGNKKKTNTIKMIRLLGHEPIVTFIAENIENEQYAYFLEHQIIHLAHEYFGNHMTNRIGVNLMPPCRKGSKHSNEARVKISEALKKRIRKPMTEEQKQRLSDTLKGQKKPERSYEHKKNIGISKAKTYVVTFPDGTSETIFNMRDFCKKHNLSQSKFCLTVSGQRKHHKGFSAIYKITEL